jgi:peptidoglycan/xylan/chitin deacetylase (PgdA/CDA1 family)
MIPVIKTPEIVIRMFPALIWRGPEDQKNVFITFDDGPTTEPTSFVLKMLRKYGARATFFCVGDNIKRNPSGFRSVLEDGHCVGNHTFSHLNGWRCRNQEYFENIRMCSDTIRASGYVPKRLIFRPPYGRMKRSQIIRIGKEFRIIMWDILTMDFDPGKNAGHLVDKIIARSSYGSILVFHDSEKAYLGLRYMLEPVLRHFWREGYGFKTIEDFLI